MSNDHEIETIDNEFELSIRRGFASDLSKFRNLKKWMDSAFYLMIPSNENLYNFRSRVKEITSLIAKTGRKKNEGKTIKDYEELKEVIKDIVGGRIITYLAYQNTAVHDIILSFKRFFVLRVIIHDKYGHRKLAEGLLEQICKDEKYTELNSKLSNLGKQDNEMEMEFCIARKYPLKPNDKDDKNNTEQIVATGYDMTKKDYVPYKIELNNRGYTGIHFIICPLTYDDYLSNELGDHIYNQFEIQVRSNIQESWGEIEHSTIYKNMELEKDRENLREKHSKRFIEVADSLHNCEDVLEGIVKGVEAEKKT